MFPVLVAISGAVGSFVKVAVSVGCNSCSTQDLILNFYIIICGSLSFVGNLCVLNSDL